MFRQISDTHVNNDSPIALRRQRDRIPEAHWLASVTKSVSSRISERLFPPQKKAGREGAGTVCNGLCL